jgi:hypothetical protein
MLSIRIAGRIPSRTIRQKSPTLVPRSRVPKSRTLAYASLTGPKKIRWKVQSVTAAVRRLPRMTRPVARRWLG